MSHKCSETNVHACKLFFKGLSEVESVVWQKRCSPNELFALLRNYF